MQMRGGIRFACIIYADMQTSFSSFKEAGAYYIMDVCAGFYA